MPRKHQLEPFRTLLDSSSGKRYWRSLEELAANADFQQAVQQEFPARISEWNDPVSRRNFLKLMGASLALAGLAGCSGKPHEEIVPYVDQPEQIVPGVPMYYATAMPFGRGATRLLVESHMGRPTKIEGNPLVPGQVNEELRNRKQIQVGPTDLFSQASILTMYDPDRSQSVLQRSEISGWRDFQSDLGEVLGILGDKVRLRILTETVVSPSLGALLKQVLDKYPNARWHQYEPVNCDAERAGLGMVFADPVMPRYRADRAMRIVSFDCDFLNAHPGTLELIDGWAKNRRVLDESLKDMNRLYVVESTPTLTGSKADHKLPMHPSRIPHFAQALAHELDDSIPDSDFAEWTTTERNWINALANDLQDQQGKCLFFAGETQAPVIHALVHRLNQKLGGGEAPTVEYVPSNEIEPVNQLDSLKDLVKAMDAEEVDLLLILGGNPIYTAPADLEFMDSLAKVPWRAHLSLYFDETSALCDWHLPQAHYLESWDDTRAFDGSVSIVQPLIAPLYDGKTAQEVLSLLTGQGARTAYNIVRDYWQSQWKGTGSFSDAWQTSLHDGFLEGFAPAAAQPAPAENTGTLGEQLSALKRPNADIALVLRPDPTIYDGRFANNGWLQECPKPLTKLTWDNVVQMSPKTARDFHFENEDLVEVQHGRRGIILPVWIVPGHADQTITVHLGYGRLRAGNVGNDAGKNAYLLRNSDQPWVVPKVELRPVEGKTDLACTQHHHLMLGRELVFSGTYDQYTDDPEHPEFMHRHHPLKEEGFFDDAWKYEEGNKWGMVVDLTTCVGCNACVIACQSENNIPVVGKEQVIIGREMHWLRIDTYYESVDHRAEGTEFPEADNPDTHFQPMMCQHCELAPCEPVCPVAATSHSSEGLNEMTYNRCVGTKYCSNNCPYKVRRFNFLHYTEPIEQLPVLQLLQNPDVTVRTRGVMEKCTYCVQRISSARIEAKKDGERAIADGEVVTACQSVCPAKAISFGNLNDKESQVAKAAATSLNFGVLDAQNTQPRTTYNASIRNPNTELKPRTAKESGHSHD